MDSANAARAVLLLDAVGCGATAGLTATVPAVLRPVDPSLRSRRPLVAALAATSAICAAGARSAAPSRAALRTAAMVNGVWVAACLTTLIRHRAGTQGTVLVTATAALDATTGTTQWVLSKTAASTAVHR